MEVLILLPNLFFIQAVNTVVDISQFKAYNVSEYRITTKPDCHSNKIFRVIIYNDKTIADEEFIPHLNIENTRKMDENNKNKIMETKEIENELIQSVKECNEKIQALEHLKEQLATTRESLLNEKSENQQMKEELEKNKTTIEKLELYLFEEKASKRSDVQVINLKNSNELQPSRITGEYKEIIDNDLSILLDSYTQGNESLYEQMQKKFTELCFLTIWDILIPGHNDELIYDTAKKIINSKTEIDDYHLFNAIKSYITESIPVIEEVCLHNFCKSCILLAAKMASAKPNIIFLTPKVGNEVKDGNYDYYKTKPVVQKLIYPWIKGEDGTIFMKAVVDVEIKLK